MGLICEEFSGSYGYVVFGDAIFFVETWKSNIEGGVIDLTTIDVYEAPNMPARDDTPDTPYQIKKPDSLLEKQAYYGAGRENFYSNLRKATIQVTGFCAKSADDLYGNPYVYLPRIGNIVRMEFANRKDKNITMFVFPEVVIHQVEYDFNIKEYMKFNFVGTTNRDFDIYPGPNDAGK
jgi:hypothetical protein